MPILPGTDGVEKMSKSLENFIGINEPPQQIYGKTLSIPDSVIFEYFLLATNLGNDELEAIKQNILTNPRDMKRRLARELVSTYYGREAAREAEAEFDRIFVKRDMPKEIPECSIVVENGGVGILRLLTETQLVPSKNEARRLIDQGGVSIDGTRIADQNAVIPLSSSVIVRVGKLKFMRVSKA